MSFWVPDTRLRLPQVNKFPPSDTVIHFPPFLPHPHESSPLSAPPPPPQKKKKKRRKKSWRIQTTNSASSTNWATSWRKRQLKHSMLLTMLIVSLLVQPSRKKRPPLSLEKTRTYWSFYYFCYFTFNLSTAKFCFRPVQSLQPKSATSTRP